MAAKCLLLLSILLLASEISGAYNKDRIRLADMQVFTAKRGHYTAARRVSAIPQMQCVGGAAGCKYEPASIQCYNRGWDGRSVQWECKADLDETVKFGSVHVLCEGYDYAGDEYVLAGSCGVEFTLEPTGKRGSSDWGGQSYNKRYGENDVSSSSIMETLIFMLVIGIVIYAVYAIFFRGSLGESAYSTTNDDYPGGDFRPSAPPPPGFQPGYGAGGDYGFRNDYTGASCGANRRSGSGSNPLGGFWTGAMTGGMLGYMFGNRNRGSGGYTTGPSYYSSPTPTSSYFSRRSGSESSSGSTTRTSSGYGGTTVR